MQQSGAISPVGFGATDFFARDALDVAVDLIGCELAYGDARVRITEVEAYRFPGDTANHARMGRTPRNAPMWGPPGHLYVYLCYGLHQMVNIVTGPEGHAAAVLLRAAEPVDGLAGILARRGRPEGARVTRALLDGPGKLGAALGLSTAHSGLRLHVTEQSVPPGLDGLPMVRHPGAPVLLPRTRAVRLARGPRIGIDYALREHRDAPWRIADADSEWVGHRRSLMEERAWHL